MGKTLALHEPHKVQQLWPAILVVTAILASPRIRNINIAVTSEGCIEVRHRQAWTMVVGAACTVR